MNRLPLFGVLFTFLMLGGILLAGCNSEPDAESAVPQNTPTGQTEQIVADSSEVISGATLPPPLVVEASHTPVPATDTPAASATPESTDTPEATEVPPTNTPAPPPPANTAAPVQPTSPPAPTNTAEPPPPPPPPATGANGLVASHFALQERSEYNAGGKVWFEFEIANSTGNEVSYSALGVMPKKDGVDRFEWYQQTYGGQNSTIKPGGLVWEDRIELPEPGSYTLRLVMCFDGFDNCLQGGGTWVSMSPEIAVQIN